MSYSSGASKNIQIKFGVSKLTLFCCYEDNSIGAPGPLNGRCIGVLEDFNVFDVCRIQSIKGT
jgi:hypothetical protein